MAGGPSGASRGATASIALQGSPLTLEADRKTEVQRGGVERLTHCPTEGQWPGTEDRAGPCLPALALPPPGAATREHTPGGVLVPEARPPLCPSGKTSGSDQGPKTPSSGPG